MGRAKETDDPVKRSLNEAALKSEDELLSQVAADEIVNAFASLLANSSALILDERLLPYPKEVIQRAFLKRISICEQRYRKEPSNLEWKKDLDQHGMVALHIADFQAIDPEDEAAVRAANEWDKQLRMGLCALRTAEERNEYVERAIKSDERIVKEWLPLRIKYFQRSAAENGITS